MEDNVAGSLTVKVSIKDVRETLAAFRHLPKDAQDELRKKSKELAEDLARPVRAAGFALGPQDAIVARSVKAARDRVPTLQAGGRGKAGQLVFGSVFGMNRRSGWYARSRFRHAGGRQFRPHGGQNAYWFFPQVEEHQAEIGRAWTEAADDIVRHWAGR